MDKVLIIESDEEHQDSWKSQLMGKVEVISIYVKEEAYHSPLYTDVSLVVVAACMGDSDEPNTQHLVEWIRQKFTGPMVATSLHSIFRDKLLEAGCNHECQKREVPTTVLDALNIGEPV